MALPDLSRLPLGTTPATGDTVAGVVTASNQNVRWAVSNFTTGGSSSTGYINVKSAPYNATGDGTTDDTAAIQAAINAAALLGVNDSTGYTGGTVFFPSGAYKVSAPLSNKNGAGTHVALLGSGRDCTRIYGTFSGFIIDQNPDTDTSGICGISSLQVCNYATSIGNDFTLGAVRFEQVSQGVVSDCLFSGWTAFKSTDNVFDTLVTACGASGGGSRYYSLLGGQIGFAFSGGGLIGCSALGFHSGVFLSSFAAPMVGGSTTSNTIPGTTGGSFTWTTGSPFALSVGAMVIAKDTFNANNYIKGQVTNNTANSGLDLTLTCVEFKGSGTKTNWLFTVASGVGTTAGQVSLIKCRFESCHYGINMYAASGGVMSGISTERCNIGVRAPNMSSMVLSGLQVTGTLGNAVELTVADGDSMVWAANVVTVTTNRNTLTNLGWASGSIPINIQGVSPAAYNAYPTAVTATRTSDHTFTYPLVGSNPGTATFPSYAAWSPQQLYGMRLGTMDGSVIVQGSNVGITGGIQVGGIDLYGGGVDGVWGGGQGCTLINVTCGAAAGGWMMPSAAGKASFIYINCDQPGGTTNDVRGVQSGMNLADLPGGSNNITVPREGMEYNVVNANTTTFGADAVAAGTASTHVRVRWNAGTSKWTVMGA